LKSLSVKNNKSEALLHLVMENGKKTQETRSLKEIVAYSRDRLEGLPMEYKRFDNPHIYKVGISKALKKERETLLKKYKK
jgi:nicotinate phosphoribosyltransferase